MKKILLGAVSLLSAFLLSACSGFGMNVTESIKAPRPSGKFSDIQKALESYAGSNPNLVYPSSGEYRSAIVTRDLNNDGRDEVFAFYSTKTDGKTTVMHINYIRYADGKWVSVSDIQTDCSGVESVEFTRLDQSAVPKIVVNWSRYSSFDRLLSVYDITGGVLKEVMSAGYSVCTSCDLDGDGVASILAVKLDPEEKTAEARLLDVGAGNAEPVTCALDGNVTSYFTPTVTKLTDGTPAIYIDAEKSTGTVTEVLYLSDGRLVSAFTSEQNPENIRTLRTSDARSEDFDGDGCLDIPLLSKLPLLPDASENDAVYITSWNSFDGKLLTPIANTVTNYSDGYYLVIPQQWVGQFTVVRRTDIKQRSFIRWDTESNSPGEEILRIRAVPVNTWESGGEELADYTELARTAECVYAAKPGNSALMPDTEQLRAGFHPMIADEN